MLLYNSPIIQKSNHMMVDSSAENLNNILDDLNGFNLDEVLRKHNQHEY